MAKKEVILHIDVADDGTLCIRGILNQTLILNKDKHCRKVNVFIGTIYDYEQYKKGKKESFMKCGTVNIIGTITINKGGEQNGGI